MQAASLAHRTRGFKAATPATTKYHNVKTVIDGITFDSKREAQHYAELKLRQKAGEISELRCQVPFDLLAPIMVQAAPCDAHAVIARYIADFVYLENGAQRVVDAKGKRTALYALKRKWLLFQSGITIIEV